MSLFQGLFIFEVCLGPQCMDTPLGVIALSRSGLKLKKQVLGLGFKVCHTEAQVGEVSSSVRPQAVIDNS